MKISKRELLAYASSINAICIDRWNFEEIEALRKQEIYFNDVAYSKGIYGVTAYLFQGNKTKKYYLVSSRNSALYQVM